VRLFQKIVIAKFARTDRLVMPLKLRLGPAHIGPLREPFAPPGVVLGDRMELGQVKCDRSRQQRRRTRQARQFGMDRTAGLDRAAQGLPQARFGKSRLVYFPVAVSGAPADQERQVPEHRSGHAVPGPRRKRDAPPDGSQRNGQAPAKCPDQSLGWSIRFCHVTTLIWNPTSPSFHHPRQDSTRHLI